MQHRLGAWLQASFFVLLLLLLPTCGNGSGTPGADDGGTDDGGGALPVAPDPILINLQEIVTGLSSPIQVTHAGDGSGRLFVVLQTGQIRVISAAGALLPAPFLDISGIMITLDTIFDERGLLGLAFHPQFAMNGRFFIRYSRARAGVAGEPCFGTSRGCHESVLSEFVVDNPATDDVANAGSEQVLLTVDQPEFNHDGGHLAFGPDGFLYFSLGDGGGANDGLDDVPPTHGPTGHGQNIDTLLGSICRIDVDSAPPMGQTYAIPPDNPFVGQAGADEIYAYGLRNPYRFSFDDGPGGTGQLLCGDVGQNLFEELNIIQNGGNYGWAVREGMECFDPFNPDAVPAGPCASTGPLGEALIDPVMVYGRTVGISIVPGFVYRGAAFPALSGHFVFGDWSSNFGPADGSLFFCHIAGPQAFLRAKLQIEPGDQDLGLTVNGFGEGEDGEIYLCGGTVSAPGGAGNILRIVPAAP